MWFTKYLLYLKATVNLQGSGLRKPQSLKMRSDLSHHITGDQLCLVDLGQTLMKIFYTFPDILPEKRKLWTFL
jgi:hypothetical protein